MQKDQTKESFCLVCFYCSPAPLKTGAARIGISGGPCKEPANATNPIFYFVAFAKIRKNKVYPLLFLPDPGELSKRKNRIPPQRGNKIALLLRSCAWGGLYSVFGRLLPPVFQTFRFYITEPKKSRLFIGFRFHVPDFQAPAESSLVFRVKHPLKENIVCLLLRVQISRIPSLQKPGFGIIVYFGTYTFFLLPRGLYFFFNSASASA